MLTVEWTTREAASILQRGNWKNKGEHVGVMWHLYRVFDTFLNQVGWHLANTQPDKLSGGAGFKFKWPHEDLYQRSHAVYQETLSSVTHGSLELGGWFTKKVPSYQYRKYYCGDKTVERSSYLHNGTSYTGKMTSLYWISALVFFYVNESIKSVWPSDAIWWHRSGSTLAQVMACCLMAPSHYLNQC